MRRRIGEAVALASDQSVLAAAARLGTVNSSWPFLPTTSQVIERNALRFIESKYNTAVTADTDKSEIASYLALSTCCHALDGWRYLAEASLALLRGARNHALHLAYYGELRAALSILAGSGIGILNNKHFVLTRSGDVVWIREMPTHAAAWKGLQEWAKNPTNALRVVEILQAFGLSGPDWAAACNAAGSPDVISAHWLNNWSVDLKTYEKDRVERNEASYRPDLQINALGPLSRKELDIVRLELPL